MIGMAFGLATVLSRAGLCFSYTKCSNYSSTLYRQEDILLHNIVASYSQGMLQEHGVNKKLGVMSTLTT